MIEERINGFADFLKNKNVIIVGPSLHLMNKAGGSFIDSHDVIVRLNNASILPKELEKDHGAKCDVIYTCYCLSRYTEDQKNKLKKVKFVFMQPNRHAPKGLKKATIEEDIEWLKENKIPFSSNHNVECAKVNKQEQREYAMSQGLQAIHHLLEQPLNSLYVTGLSFYRLGKITADGKDSWINCKPCHSRSHDMAVILKHYGQFNNKIIQGPPKSRGTHNLVLDENVFFEIYAKDNRIKLDKYLEDLASKRK